ncbi:MAG: hypothetical protein VCC04_15600 [Myxococcota bacterium]
MIENCMPVQASFAETMTHSGIQSKPDGESLSDWGVISPAASERLHEAFLWNRRIICRLFSVLSFQGCLLQLSAASVLVARITATELPPNFEEETPT